jgi:hypothetical protein
VNGYGLFAVMTTVRHEIVVEGSDDGQRWLPYEFRWKPGRLDRRPLFVAPHMPRVDWQMWFAALGTCRHNPWFLRLQQRLLDGSPAVARLLDGNPFPAHPPRFVRSRVFDYRFATPEEHAATGAWWSRGEPLGDFCPALTLDGGRLSEARF